MSPKRELGTAVGAVLAGATLAVLGAGRAWLSGSAAAGPGLPVIELAPTGRALAPGVVALSLVALAGLLALAGTRGRGRVGVGIVVALAGAGVAVLAGTSGAVGDVEATAYERASAALGTSAPSVTGVAGTPWPLVTSAAGALVAAGGVLISLRGPRWAGLGRRFESSASAPAPAEPGPGERRIWDALDRGEDPSR